MSLLSQYKKERENKETLEVDQGFVIYEILDNSHIYIEDIYVVPEARKSHLATRLSEQVCKLAKERGAKILLGSVCVGSRGDTTSLKVLLAHGMQLHSIDGKIIYFFKEI